MYDDLTCEPQEGIAVLDFVAARATELQHLQSQLGFVSSGFVHALQRLPRRMRRRAASHNPRRLPLRLRRVGFGEAAKAGLQLKKQQQQQQQQKKRLKRLFRRRNRTRLAKERSDWLATHLWHAKRFHMVNKWGYRLADRPTDKTLRPCLRAALRGALLYDASYYCPCLISGPASSLANRFSRLLSPDDNNRLRYYLNTKRQFSIQLVTHVVDCHPLKCLGPVRLDCLTSSASDPTELTIWLWCHPMIQEALAVELNASAQTADNCSKGTVKWQRDQFSCYRLVGPAAAGLLDKFLVKPDGLTADDEAQWSRWRNRDNLLQPGDRSDVIVHSVELTVSALHFNQDYRLARRDIPTLPSSKSLTTPATGSPLAEVGRFSVPIDAPRPVEKSSTSSASSVRIVLLRRMNAGLSNWDIVLSRQGLDALPARRLWLSLVRRCPVQVGGLREAGLSEADCLAAASSAAWSFPAGFPDSVGLEHRRLPDNVDHLLRDCRLLNILDRLVRGRLPIRSFLPSHALQLRPSLATSGVRVLIHPIDRGRPQTGGQLLAAKADAVDKSWWQIGDVLDGRQSMRLGRPTGEAVASLTSLIEAANWGSQLTGRFAFRNPRSTAVRLCRLEITSWH